MNAISHIDFVLDAAFKSAKANKTKSKLDQNGNVISLAINAEVLRDQSTNQTAILNHMRANGFDVSLDRAYTTGQSRQLDENKPGELERYRRSIAPMVRTAIKKGSRLKRFTSRNARQNKLGEEHSKIYSKVFSASKLMKKQEETPAITPNLVAATLGHEPAKVTETKKITERTGLKRITAPHSMLSKETIIQCSYDKLGVSDFDQRNCHTRFALQMALKKINTHITPAQRKLIQSIIATPDIASFFLEHTKNFFPSAVINRKVDKETGEQLTEREWVKRLMNTIINAKKPYEVDNVVTKTWSMLNLNCLTDYFQSIAGTDQWKEYQTMEQRVQRALHEAFEQVDKVTVLDRYDGFAVAIDVGTDPTKMDEIHAKLRVIADEVEARFSVFFKDSILKYPYENSTHATQLIKSLSKAADNVPATQVQTNNLGGTESLLDAFTFKINELSRLGINTE